MQTRVDLRYQFTAVLVNRGYRKFQLLARLFGLPRKLSMKLKQLDHRSVVNLKTKVWFDDQFLGGFLAEGLCLRKRGLSR